MKYISNNNLENMITDKRSNSKAALTHPVCSAQRKRPVLHNSFRGTIKYSGFNFQIKSFIQYAVDLSRCMVGPQCSPLNVT